MQIVGINIGPAAAPSGLPLVRVVFEGEGGESVAVEMARGEDADGALSAIERAKALLVQTATFEMPVSIAQRIASACWSIFSPALTI